MMHHRWRMETGWLTDTSNCGEIPTFRLDTVTQGGLHFIEENNRGDPIQSTASRIVGSWTLTGGPLNAGPMV